MSDSLEVTNLLNRVGAGDASAPDELLPLVYGELRKLAQGYLKNEREGHTLQATALVHEAYIRLVDWENVSWQNRAHFFSVAANVMRRILVDHARARRAEKRGFGQTLALDEAISFSSQREVDLVRLDDALESLAAIDPVQEKIVELRFFGGLTIDETAHALQVSPSTVKREWTVAKAWLFREISR
ncbi:MAG TPA: sigma-70 family RNA polymerase sigma factor [Pyrinomonadaceae bacterium]|nr:sigma-70 family RNA polymerase sigma factor [Chloracidobacterium sp.]HQX56273.1 sigma-70 family RNA polymerase sigma factor [Pyrinomonadaceae bacterium]MBK7804518.1 sigma-70 family RNA polymerase sigma factor [Chloracidobacterium sp.]MBK9438921.1 sigma-70 family RNA polymerase sigma factor [Chloracidobacterium sp.]MBL0240443.1 sigma-70 family RNA polymerase sigma factor [Chloracidobacterium sp.]